MTHNMKLHWATRWQLSSAILGLGFKSQMGRLLQLPNELPAQTCSDAQSNGLYYDESIPTPPPGPDPLPFPKAVRIEPPTKLPKITLKGQSVSPRDFMPDDLTFQPFEGYPEDIGRVGQVLREADAGKRIRLTFFGASHTAGDFWTGQIRRVLQARYGDIGHGFVMPVAMAKGSRGHDINLCSNGVWKRDYVGKEDGHGDDAYGLGMSVSSSNPADFAWAETTHQNPLGRNFSSARIFTLGTFGGGGLLAQIDRSDPFLLPTNRESAELIETNIHVPLNGHRITLSPIGDGEVRIFGMSLESEGPGTLVDSIGIRGRQAKTWLQWNETILRDMLSILNPDIIVLAYGTNEANDTDYDMEHYERDLRSVLDKMQRVHPTSSCILVGPSDRGSKINGNKYTVWERTRLVAEVQRTVAPDFGCVFWDWQQATGGAGSMIAWNQTNPRLASNDLIHFTGKGYQVSADQFLKALDDAALNFQDTTPKNRFRLWKK